MNNAALVASAVILSVTLAMSNQIGPAQAQAVAPAATGETIFRQRCSMCHAIASRGGRVGPDLAGVVGRRAGSTAYAYSPAMKASTTVWNGKTLDAYLAAPTRAVPGTKMVIATSNPADRAAVISYLTGVRK